MISTDRTSILFKTVLFSMAFYFTVPCKPGYVDSILSCLRYLTNCFIPKPILFVEKLQERNYITRLSDKWYHQRP